MADSGNGEGERILSGDPLYYDEDHHKKVANRPMITCADLISNDVDDIIKRMQKAKGVTGLIVINSDGIPIRTNLDNSTTVSYAGLIQQLVGKSTSVVRDLDPTNDLKFLRIKSKKHEIMASPVEVQQIEFALRTPNKMVDEYWSHGVDLMDILHGSAENGYLLIVVQEIQDGESQ